MPRQDEIHTHKKAHGVGGLDCKADTTGNSKVGLNYSLLSRIFKPALYLLLAAIYVPMYCGLILTLPLLPTRLANRLIDWLAVDQGGA